MFLGDFTKPIITLNATRLKSDESLQINCSATKLEETASFLYEIQVNGATVANENNSFVFTIQSVQSTGAENYTCQVSLIAGPANIVGVSIEEFLSGKSTFHLCQIWKCFFFLFCIIRFLHDGTLDLERANPFQSGVVFHKKPFI